MKNTFNATEFFQTMEFALFNKDMTRDVIDRLTTANPHVPRVKFEIVMRLIKSGNYKFKRNHALNLIMNFFLKYFDSVTDIAYCDEILAVIEKHLLTGLMDDYFYLIASTHIKVVYDIKKYEIECGTNWMACFKYDRNDYFENLTLIQN